MDKCFNRRLTYAVLMLCAFISGCDSIDDLEGNSNPTVNTESGGSDNDNNNGSVIAGIRSVRIHEDVNSSGHRLFYWVATDGSGVIQLLRFVNSSTVFTVWLPDDAFVRRVGVDIIARNRGYSFSSNDAYAANNGLVTVSYQGIYGSFDNTGGGNTGGGNDSGGVDSRPSERILTDCSDFSERGFVRNTCNIRINVRWWTETGSCNNGCGVTSVQPGRKQTIGGIDSRYIHLACRYGLLPFTNQGSGSTSNLTYQTIQRNNIRFACR